LVDEEGANREEIPIIINRQTEKAKDKKDEKIAIIEDNVEEIA